MATPTNIWAFDLGLITGIAMGVPPENLADIKYKLVSLREGRAKHPHDELTTDAMLVCQNLTGYLQALFAFKDYWPSLCIIEKPHSPQFQIRGPEGKPMPRNDTSILFPLALNITLQQFLDDRDIPFKLVHPNTYRPSFIGSTGSGNRRITKDMMIRRAVEYGYMPASTKMSERYANAADAIALWHFSQIKYGGWRPPVEFLMNKKLVVR